MKKRYLAVAALIGYVLWNYVRPITSTTISLRIGQRFEQVVSASTFPVISASMVPNNPHGSGATWVKEPAVIIQFNDPHYGFTLPATTFAVIGYMDGKVDDISTSPMLSKATFGQAITTLEILQRQFQSSGWQPEFDTNWFDLTPRGRDQLHQHVRSVNNGFMKTTILVVPGKYEMIFRLWCAARCDSQIGLDRYLIDIGVSADVGFEFNNDTPSKR